MITIDSRKGSAELLPLFPSGAAQLGFLQYADFAFTGNGPNNIPWLVGVERKTIRDLLNSMTGGRFAGHQLIGLLNEYNTVYLIVEGLFRPCPKDGILEIYSKSGWYTLEVGNRTYMMSDIQMWLNTLAVKCGIHCLITRTDIETMRQITALYNWWVRKDFEEHRSHLQPNTGQVAVLVRHSIVRRIAAQLTGIGWERAKDIDNHFESVEAMCWCGENEWQEVPGIGKKLATSIINELRGL